MRSMTGSCLSYASCMNGRMTDTAGWQPFMEAYAAHRASRGTHPDLANFYRRRYEVFCDLIGIELTQAEGDGWKGRAEWELLDAFAVAIPTLNSPFSRYLEAPSSIVALYGSFAPSINELFASQRRNYLDVMAACAARLWGVCPVLVTDDDLCRYGVGRRQEPDEVDYF